MFCSIKNPQGNIVERIYRELSRFFKSLIGENHGLWWSWINIIESCMNENYHETTEFTPIELHLNKKPKRAWENWLHFHQNSPNISYERELQMAKDNISRKGKNRASKFNVAHRLISLKEEDHVLVKPSLNRTQNGRFLKNVCKSMRVHMK